KTAQASIKLSIEGPLKALDGMSQSVSVPANREARVVFNIAAVKDIGAAKVIISVNALNESFTNTTELAIRPPAGLQKQTYAGSVTAGSEQQITLANNFLTGTSEGSITISSSPMVQFSKNLSYLVQYPHGCLEQTTS